jgi:hypothetical protein
MARRRNGMSDCVGYVYMIRPRCHHTKDIVVPYKIGWTKNDPELRLAELQTSNWHSLEIYMYCGRSMHANRMEKTIHNELRKKEKSAPGGSEWFYLTLADVRRVRSKIIKWGNWLAVGDELGN